MVRPRLRLPCAAGYRRYKRIKILRRKVNYSPLFGTHVGGHQQLAHFETVIKVLFRLPAFQKTANEVPVFSLITVCRFLVVDYRHHTLLGVLLFYKVFAGLAGDVSTEKELQTAI